MPVRIGIISVPKKPISRNRFPHFSARPAGFSLCLQVAFSDAPLALAHLCFSARPVRAILGWKVTASTAGKKGSLAFRQKGKLYDRYQ